MKIGTKLTIAFLAVVIIGVALGITGLASTTNLTDMSGELNSLRMKTNSISNLLNSHYIWRQDLTEAVFTGSKFTGSLDAENCSLSEWLKSPEAKSITDENVLLMLASIHDPHEVMHSEARIVLELYDDGNPYKAQDNFKKLILPSSYEVINTLTDIHEYYIGQINALTEDIVTTGNHMTTLIIVFIIVAIAAGVLLSVLIPPTIVRPIRILASTLEKTVASDFTVRLPDKYGGEIGTLFDTTNTLLEFNDKNVSQLAGIVSQLRGSAEGMLTISTDMAANGKGLNAQTSSVSTATEEFSAAMTQSVGALSTASTHISAVASSIEEINSTISTVAAAAEETSARVNQSSELVDSIQNSIVKASDSVKMVSDAFNNVADSVDDISKSIVVVSEHSTDAKNQMSDAGIKAKNTNEIIRRLEAASKQIGKIISVINDIADQTNMLALNAAIEAAGAGEAGKGFMVVANEVKELAKQTADATDEIADHIENMQKNMPEAVGAVTEITAIIDGMIEYVNSFAAEMSHQEKRSDEITTESAAAAKRMNEIAAEIDSISENAKSVTRTVVDSTKGVNEIAKSTAELVIGTQEIAMNSERASNNISEITRTANEMVSGLVDISRNIQMINEEAGTSQLSADAAKNSSEELLKTANGMDELISKYKTSY